VNDEKLFSDLREIKLAVGELVLEARRAGRTYHAVAGALGEELLRVLLDHDGTAGARRFLGVLDMQLDEWASQYTTGQRFDA